MPTRRAGRHASGVVFHAEIPGLRDEMVWSVMTWKAAMTSGARDSDPRFWDKIAYRYAARRIGDEAAYDHTLERVRSYITGADQVLELACGTGTTALKLADCVSHYMASDLSQAMITIAQERARTQGRTDVRFIRIGLEDLDPANGQYDAVLAFSFFHLMTDLETTIARAATLIKPGGLLISKTICLGEMNPAFRVVLPFMRLLGLAPHVAFLRSAQLDEVIRRTGFQILETGMFPKKPPARFIVARKAGL